MATQALTEIAPGTPVAPETQISTRQRREQRRAAHKAKLTRTEKKQLGREARYASEAFFAESKKQHKVYHPVGWVRNYLEPLVVVNIRSLRVMKFMRDNGLTVGSLEVARAALGKGDVQNAIETSRATSTAREAIKSIAQGESSANVRIDELSAEHAEKMTPIVNEISSKVITPLLNGQEMTEQQIIEKLTTISQQDGMGAARNLATEEIAQAYKRIAEQMKRLKDAGILREGSEQDYFQQQLLSGKDLNKLSGVRAGQFALSLGQFAKNPAFLALGIVTGFNPVALGAGAVFMVGIHYGKLRLERVLREIDKSRGTLAKSIDTSSINTTTVKGKAEWLFGKVGQGLSVDWDTYFNNLGRSRSYAEMAKAVAARTALGTVFSAAFNFIGDRFHGHGGGGGAREIPTHAHGMAMPKEQPAGGKLPPNPNSTTGGDSADLSGVPTTGDPYADLSHLQATLQENGSNGSIISNAQAISADLSQLKADIASFHDAGVNKAFDQLQSHIGTPHGYGNDIANLQHAMDAAKAHQAAVLQHAAEVTKAHQEMTDATAIQHELDKLLKTAPKNLASGKQEVLDDQFRKLHDDLGKLPGSSDAQKAVDYIQSHLHDQQGYQEQLNTLNKYLARFEPSKEEQYLQNAATYEAKYISENAKGDELLKQAAGEAIGGRWPDAIARAAVGGLDEFNAARDYFSGLGNLANAAGEHFQQHPITLPIDNSHGSAVHHMAGSTATHGTTVVTHASSAVEGGNTFPISLNSIEQHFQNVIFNNDTPQHNWQELHSFMHTTNGKPDGIILGYTPKDTVVDPSQLHVVLFTPDGKEIVLENNAAIIPGSNQIVHAWDGQGNEMNISSGSLANLLGLNQAKIDNFNTITNGWIKLHGVGQGYTQYAADLYKNIGGRFVDTRGEALLNLRAGGGYVSSDGTLHIGASNLTWNHNAVIPSSVDKITAVTAPITHTVGEDGTPLGEGMEHVGDFIWQHPALPVQIAAALLGNRLRVLAYGRRYPNRVGPHGRGAHTTLAATTFGELAIGLVTANPGISAIAAWELGGYLGTAAWQRIFPGRNRPQPAATQPPAQNGPGGSAGTPAPGTIPPTNPPSGNQPTPPTAPPQNPGGPTTTPPAGQMNNGTATAAPPVPAVFGSTLGQTEAGSQNVLQQAGTLSDSDMVTRGQEAQRNMQQIVASSSPENEDISGLAGGFLPFINTMQDRIQRSDVPTTQNINESLEQYGLSERLTEGQDLSSLNPQTLVELYAAQTVDTIAKGRDDEVQNELEMEYPWMKKLTDDNSKLLDTAVDNYFSNTNEEERIRSNKVKNALSRITVSPDRPYKSIPETQEFLKTVERIRSERVLTPEQQDVLRDRIVEALHEEFPYEVNNSAQRLTSDEVQNMQNRMNDEIERLARQEYTNIDPTVLAQGYPAFVQTLETELQNPHSDGSALSHLNTWLTKEGYLQLDTPDQFHQLSDKSLIRYYSSIRIGQLELAKERANSQESLTDDQRTRLLHDLEEATWDKELEGTYFARTIEQEKEDAESEQLPAAGLTSPLIAQE